MLILELLKRHSTCWCANGACTQHDAQLDYYSKRLTTCSSDRTVKVFDVVNGEAQKSPAGHTLKGCVPYPTVLYRDHVVRALQTHRAHVAGRVGTPELRAHPRVMLVRRQGADME